MLGKTGEEQRRENGVISYLQLSYHDLWYHGRVTNLG